MSAARKPRPPRPVEQLIRGESADERLTMVAIQVDHSMHVVEAMAGVMMAFAHAARAAQEAERKTQPKTQPILPELVEAALVRLDAVLRDERREVDLTQALAALLESAELNQQNLEPATLLLIERARDALGVPPA